MSDDAAEEAGWPPADAETGIVPARTKRQVGADESCFRYGRLNVSFAEPFYLPEVGDRSGGMASRSFAGFPHIDGRRTKSVAARFEAVLRTIPLVLPRVRVRPAGGLATGSFAHGTLLQD